MARRFAAALPLCLLLLAGSLPQSQGDTVIVTRKETKLRSQKRLFAPSVANLVEGDKLEVLDKDGAWLNVKFADKIGFLHATDVSTNKEVRLSGEGVRENYSASEAAAARKGFNPQVEKQYRLDNPDLNKAFELVDRIQGQKTDEKVIEQFLRQGGLLKEGQ